jgi:hypothetical protein
VSSNSESGAPALARLFVDIAVWRRGPQDLPVAAWLLPAAIIVYALASLLSGWAAAALLAVPSAPRRGLGYSAIVADVLFVAGWYWVLLQLFRRRERYPQTASAVFGVSALLTPPSVLAMQLVLLAVYGKVDWLSPVALIAALAMLVWTVLAMAHILRHALERGLGQCVALVLMQLAAEQLLALMLFPSGA